MGTHSMNPKIMPSWLRIESDPMQDSMTHTSDSISNPADSK